MKQKSFIYNVSILVLMFFWAACNTPTPVTTPAQPTKDQEPPIVTPLFATPIPTDAPTDETITLQVLEDAGKVEHADDDEKVDPNVDPKGDGTRYIVETRTITKTLESVTYLGQNDDIIWPGNLVRGDNINVFIYEPIIVNRAPVILSLSLESSPTTGPSITQQVDNPSLSTIRQGINDLLRKALTDQTEIPARVEFTYERIYNESQMNLFLGTDVKVGPGKLNANFNWDSTEKRTKILGIYRQIYYSVDIDPPSSPATFIDASMTGDELKAAMPPGSNPMYISEVTYGMMALVFIETNASEQDIKAALNLAYSGGANVKVSGGFTAQQILDSSSIKIIVYGGSTKNINDLEKGYEGFKKIIESSSDFSLDTPGIPLDYKFRHLADNTLARTTLISSYEKIVKLQQTIEITPTSISAKTDQAICNLYINVYAYDYLNENNTYEMIDHLPDGNRLWTLTGQRPWNPRIPKEIDDLQIELTFSTDPNIFNFYNARIEIIVGGQQKIPGKPNCDKTDRVIDFEGDPKYIYVNEILDRLNQDGTPAKVGSPAEFCFNVIRRNENNNLDVRLNVCVRFELGE